MQTTSEWLDEFVPEARYWFLCGDPECNQKIKNAISDRIAAERAEAVKERTDLINLKFKALEAGLIAVSNHLDKPFTDDPRWTPWSRFILPRAKMVREAIKGNDIGEMAAMAQSKPKEKQES